MATALQGFAHAADQHAVDGVVHGAPLVLLRLEGMAALVVAVLLYPQFGLGWGWFAALFLVPDLSMLGYLVDRRMGAGAYNAGHSYLLPLLTMGFGVLLALPPLVAIGLIWVAHIGFDRTVGYGFKYGDAFKHTHLGTPFAGKRLQ